MALLFKEDAVQAVSLVYKKFSKKRLQIAQEQLNQEFNQYHPILANSQNFRFISNPQSFTEASKRKNSPSLLVRSEYKNFPSLKPLYGENALFEPIYSNKAAEFEFSQNINKGINLIQEYTPHMFQIYKDIISEVCPVKRKGTNCFRCNFGFSDLRLIGLIFTSVRLNPYPVFFTAQSLIHELSHNIVYLYQSGQDLFINKKISHVYSGIRKTDRPIYGSFHGAVALASMKFFCLKLLEGKSFNFIKEKDLIRLLKEHQVGLSEGLNALSMISLTNLGQALFKELIEINKQN